MVLLIGCELFTPRESEPPIDATDPYAWLPPTAPEVVLQNLSNAFPANKTNYHLDGLSNNHETEMIFSFRPDERVRNLQPSVFEPWGYPEEENFITKLFQRLNDDGLQRLDWEIDQILPTDDQYVIVADYQLTLSYVESNETLPSQINGQATLTLVQNEDQLYEVLIWQDYKPDSLPCWSDLKTLVQ